GLGTLNGLVLSNIRLPYSLAVRNQGPAPKSLAKVHRKVKMPLRAALLSTVISGVYLTLWYFSLNETFGVYIAIDEIPIVMVYGIYFVLYLWYMKKFTDLNWFHRFVKPIMAMIGASIILYGGITNPSIGLYLLISLGVMVFGLLFYRKESEY
ncbi:MAG TPA: amino acid permease, partial [Eubacteriaceae bacterium]|nr:amino acid permease [Eubacteriaceae bacterium]